MRHIDNPEFGAVVFRRVSPQITNEGGLWDEAGKIYPLIGGVPRIGDLQWVFPSGARVSFHHLQHEATKYAWQGSQIPLICFDELTHFSESQFWYLASRNRSTCGVRPYIRGTCNADGSSWVKRLCAPWVDRKFPDPAASGEIRWLVRKDGLYHWARTRQELEQQYPGVVPKSVTFVRATLYDNVDLMRKDPDYLGNLQAQSPVEQARLLHGDWDVVNDGLVYPEFGSCVVEPEDWPSGLDGEQSGGIDWGFNNPFAALNGVFDGDDVLWIWGERYGSKVTLGEHSKAMPRIPGRWWGDPAGADQIAEVRAAGHDVVPCVHLGQNSLENGIGMVTERIRTGRLKVLGTCGNTIEEAGKYRYDPKTGKPIDKDNHALAALRYLIVGHDRGRSIDPGGKQALERERDRVALQGGKRAQERERLALELQRTQEREREEAAERERRLAEWLDPENDFFFGG
ncbi:terminase large subunit domain-containing protein [Singulisphaera sp. PoT]|uniref:terminase large subunit domain-containing protein n=1 Tax=Singulisphaera sp. PoT TaxID=3411797 RepID=UPI003BF60A88